MLLGKQTIDGKSYEFNGSGQLISDTGDISLSESTYIATGEVIDVQTILNVRKGPGTNYDSIGQLHQGDKVSIVAKNGEWYKTSSPIAGYVHSDFINIIEIGESKNEEINNKALEKIKLIMSALSKNVDITGERQFGHPLDIYDHIIKVTATFGIEAYTNSKAQIKFKITDKNFDDSTLIGMFTKKGVSHLSIYSDFIKEFITKSTIAFENGDIELSYDISKLNLEIKYSSYIKGNSESDLGAKVYFKIGFSLSDNIKNQIIDDVKSYINKVIDDIKRCIENVIEKIDNTSIRDEIISLSLITMFVMLYNKSKNFINGNLKLEALVASFLVFISSTNVVELNKKVNEFFGV